MVDDGADLTAAVHEQHPELLPAVVGGTEITSTGVVRMRSTAAEAALRYPALPTNDALTEHLFDNRYGTGQHTVDGILRATTVLLAGAPWWWPATAGAGAASRPGPAARAPTSWSPRWIRCGRWTPSSTACGCCRCTAPPPKRTWS
ncbi:hypothetical protein GCM10023108_38410 [Saccharopolyspora hordei]